MNLSYYKWPVIVAIVFFPLFALTVHRAANVIFYLLLLLSLIGIFNHRDSMGDALARCWVKYWPINLAMIGMMLAILINQISTGNFVGRSYDAPFRIALFPLIFWVLYLLPVKDMKHLQWGLIGGAFFSAINMAIITNIGTTRENLGYFIPIIAFAEMGLLLGVFAVLSIGWNARNEKALIFLKLLAGCASVYGAYLSQSRGAWIAVPVFMAIGLMVLKSVRAIHKLYAAMLLVIVLGAVFYYGDIARDRIGAAKEDISQYVQNTNDDTSIGIRFQLWRGSWILFGEHPYFGVSRERFSTALQDISKRQIISPMAATFPHPHNEFLYNMATLGSFGLFAIFGLYFIPGYYFLRETRHADLMARSAAGMGLALCLGFFVFGLVDVMFMWGICNTFYVISAATFFAFIVKRKEELEKLSCVTTVNSMENLRMTERAEA